MEDAGLQTGEQHGRRRSGDFEKREVSRFRVNGTIQHGRRRTGGRTGVHLQWKTRSHKNLGKWEIDLCFFDVFGITML